MNNYVVVIGGGKNSVLVVDKIHKLGLKALVVDRNSNAPGITCANEKIILSTYKSKPIIRELIKFQSHQKIVAVATRSSGIPVITAAEIADVLNLPGPGKEAARILTYKDSFAKLCAKRGIPTAGIQLLDFQRIQEQVSRYIPCVIKPTLGLVGKKGVRLILKESEIDSAVESARQASLSKNVLIEKYIPGIDISLISMVYDRELYPCFYLREKNKFDKEGKVDFNGFYLFDELKNREKKELVKIAKRIVEAADVKFSPFLISFRLMDNKKAIPVEVNLDFGGENVLDEVVPQKTDFDFIKCYLESIIYKTKPLINI